ncbi:hypothetical protein HGJ08_001559 [Salmonella enterica]|nr:hypothetical protein [Salmonella enterica]
MKDITQLVFHAKKGAVAKGVAQDGTIWFDNDDADEIDALSTLAIKKAGFKRSDFFKPVRVNHLVVDDMPAEGFFDTAFCERYKLAEDGKNWLLPASPEATDSGDTSTAADASTETTADAATCGSADTVTGTASVDSGENLPAHTCNVNDEPMKEVLKGADVSIATLPLAQRFLHLFFFGEEGNGKYRHHATPAQRNDIIRMEMDTDNRYAQNLLTGVRAHPDLDKLDNHRLFGVADAIGKIFHYPTDGQFSPALANNFISAWLNTEHIDRSLLVKEWQKGNRVSRIEKPAATGGSDTPETPEATVTESTGSDRPRRSEKPTYRTINYELACGFYEDLDLNNLRPAMDFAKRIIAEDREDWKRMSAAAGVIPDIKDFDRQTIIDLVRKAPKAVHTGSPELRRTWCESFLAVHGVRDPDWYEYTPGKASTTHEENVARIRQAGKCLRDIAAGRFQCDEKELLPADTLADEPAAPETAEPDTAEHNQDAQSVDAQPQVNPVEVAYQKKQAELHEARKNIPPKTPVDAGKQLAAARGEYVEGISDPNDPKWVPGIQTRDTSSEGEKTENLPSNNDIHSTEPPEEKNTAVFDQNAPDLEKIAHLLEVNNHLLEMSISHQFAAFRRREKFLTSLVLALTTCCENHCMEDKTNE